MEAGRHKCEPYWDDDKPMAVSFFNVAVKETFHLAEYSIRKIQVTQTKSGKLTQKTFDHYHFTSWPDHGVPNVLDLLDFLWKTRDTPRPRPGPVLVHCSAGIGRTGTYIALHILIDEMNATGQLNILQTITKMRHQRKNMIQTKEQYECVFITLLEVVKYGQTSMPTNHYLQAYPTKGGNLTMGRKTIDQLAEDIVSMNSPHNADAQVKNRLWVNGQQDQFVVGAPSQLLKQGYLLAHTPYKTEHLLWKLITETNSLTLITLGAETGLEFIPHPSHICEYGRVTVATVNETRLTRGVTLKTLSVGKTSDSEKKEIANYSVDLWSDETDSSSVIEHLIILMEQMENRQKKLKSHPVTIVFNVSDTKQAISLCIMNNIMSTISVHKGVEIFNNVRRFQDVLPNVEFTEETFRLFCQLAFVYLESTGVYTNM
ncbi:receptor-type tyrosine-protein phosphatase alpha-like [Gigantopelta aegis]|uniref:receptor-type tyrosine-protein phosphatase alpha-like n=1 Tax=Gigantopelta aegis TaxID=1735272 RepID=UPI001B88C888|nr:receptor-type tyrosine-protein phosphatase alpha-like [Gigantopelta aegis]